MSHLDEGRLTLLLDGELDPAERSDVERHLAACAECRRLYDEVRGLAGEADRLVATVEPESWPAPVLPPRRAVRPPRWERLRPLAWAATVVLAAGLGWYASDLRPRADVATEVAGAPLVQRPTAESAPTPASPTVAGPSTSAPVARDAAPAREQRAPAAAVSAEAEDRDRLAAEPAAKANLALQGGMVAGAAPASPPPELRAAPETATGAALQSRDEAAGRRRMAEAPAERQLGPAPRPATLEEAVQVLGGTVRLIDGLAPAAIRIGAGSLLPDGNPAAPMVRIVYRDPPGRELWLDQQRIEVPEADLPAGVGRTGELLPGDTLAGTTPEGQGRLRWLDRDGFRLVLTGWLPGDSLRALARRVR